MHMYVYLCVLVGTHPLIHLYAYACKYMYPSIRVCIRMHMYVNLCVLVATHPLIHLYAYVCKYMYPSIRVCIQMYVYLYVLEVTDPAYPSIRV